MRTMVEALSVDSDQRLERAQRPGVLTKRFSWVGVALGLGAPIGFGLLRRLLSCSRSPVRRRLAGERLAYAYMAVSTPLVFALFGRVL